eukprot:CAMPEP_0181372344 /NCGR_PEP_ID=MMETSP1106-20121128/14667_1 /TAXON_ID=81844 /ORGANISM="Mantoniella antarctica, Strain SL-175" /LENGTH=119 /DNA_ID=CAMNT_0023489713 /DNA_START=367 /DNA_END=722 /DNA_ORIENTATION=-
MSSEHSEHEVVRGHLLYQGLQEDPRAHVRHHAHGDGDGQGRQRLVIKPEQEQRGDEPLDDGEVAGEHCEEVVHGGAPYQHAVEDEVAQAELDGVGEEELAAAGWALLKLEPLAAAATAR